MLELAGFSTAQSSFRHLVPLVSNQVMDERRALVESEPVVLQYIPLRYD